MQRTGPIAVRVCDTASQRLNHFTLTYFLCWVFSLSIYSLQKRLFTFVYGLTGLCRAVGTCTKLFTSVELKVKGSVYFSGLFLTALDWSLTGGDQALKSINNPGQRTLFTRRKKETCAKQMSPKKFLSSHRQHAITDRDMRLSSLAHRVEIFLK